VPVDGAQQAHVNAHACREPAPVVRRGHVADNSVEAVLRIQRTNEKTFRPQEWSADLHGDRR
jgi:hypothetical protein